mgnify:CR=1 FL=1|tara:strand:+ start:2894 stop:4237 length:1344 start_codon:yes stop_codon:yes gene_type:complete
MKSKDVKKIIKEELKNILTEREFVVIDPRGNARPVGMKIQGAQYVKKMGGARKGYHLVLKKNAMKARRAIEKNGGNATNTKIQNIMFDLLYEGKLTEANQYKDVSNRFKNALDVMPEKYFNKKGVLALIKKLKEKNPEAAMAYTMDAFGWMKGMKEGKLNEVKDRKLAKLFKQSLKASAKDGEDKLYKLSQDWEDWNVDNDDKYDDLVDPLFAAIELVQDAGEPGKNNVVKDKEYYSYIKSADKHLKTFNRDVKKAMSLHKESVNEMEGVPHYTKDGKEWTGPTHKMPNGKLMTQDPHNDDSEELFHKEDLKEDNDSESRMAKSDLFKMSEYSKKIHDMLKDDMNLPEWVESKITKASDYLGSVKHYIEYEMKRGENFNEGKLNEAPMDKRFAKEWERNCKVLITHLEHEQKTKKLGAHKGTVKKMIDMMRTVKGYPDLMGSLFGEQ